MKIEKVNENQIRCTLTREDLASRELKLSELAYGSEKAKSLFRDMMQQANFEFGFEAEDIPLMIEAIPLNAECIVLIITKVEDPEELDTRFSRFAPSAEDDNEEIEVSDSTLDEVSDLFHRIQDAQTEAPAESSASAPVSRVFRFQSLRQVMNASGQVKDFYHGTNILYKDSKDSTYLLLLKSDTDSLTDFDKTCNLLSEYGTLQKTSSFSIGFLEEHCEVLIPENALSSLGQ